MKESHTTSFQRTFRVPNGHEVEFIYSEFRCVNCYSFLGGTVTLNLSTVFKFGSGLLIPLASPNLPVGFLREGFFETSGCGFQVGALNKGYRFVWFDESRWLLVSLASST